MEDMNDDYVDDFEQFGEEATSPQDNQKMIKVVTNPKQQKQDSSATQQKEGEMTQSGKPMASEWDFDEDGFSENLFSSKATANVLKPQADEAEHNQMNN